MKIIFYDFEVFIKDWLVVIIDYETNEKTTIINNRERLCAFYEQHKDDIWAGFNSRNYDQFILKGLLLGMNPYDINNEIILNDKKGYYVVSDSDKIQLNNFDISNAFRGLKELEGFMGSTIKESSVPFDIKRKLTEKELLETETYCTHDVEQTIKVFDQKKEEYDSQKSLIETFNLPMEMFNKTKAQLAAHVLGATRQVRGRDEFNLSYPDTLSLPEKYMYILDWYKDARNHDYTSKLYTDVARVPHIFAWGGIHGAIDNYTDEGIILCCDVASLYPSLMIEYGYLSRNVTEPQLYKDIRDTRLKLKAEKNPMQLPYKIVLNSTYGAMKDKHNDLFDPLMANNVCIAGQLLLLDLISMLEPYCELIQSNTDGLFLKVADEETVQLIKNIAKDWEKRTRLDLEWEVFTKIFQKDVNNYIIIAKDGKYKSKGSYVKKLSNIDYDLPIVNSALLNYFIHDKPIEETINECDDLREYQKIVKVSRLYNYAWYGDVVTEEFTDDSGKKTRTTFGEGYRLPEKVLRTFASTDPQAKGVYKVKNEDKLEKIANTPEKCFIYNDSVIDVKIPQHLDKQYYIDLANKRLTDFIDLKNKKVSKMPSDLKFISRDIKDEILQIYKTGHASYVDFLVDIFENSSVNARQIEIMTKLNYFDLYGRNKKLSEIFTMFTKGKYKYDKKYTEKTKSARLEFLYEYEKTVEDLAFPIREQMDIDVAYTGKLTTIYNLPSGFSYIIELDTKNSPRAKVYGLSTGKTVDIKIQKKHFTKLPFKAGDIVQFKKIKKKPKVKFAGKDLNGKAIFERVPGEYEIWSEHDKYVNTPAYVVIDFNKL